MTALSTTVVPNRLEIMGDDRTLVIRPRAFEFNDETFRELAVTLDRRHAFLNQLSYGSSWPIFIGVHELSEGIIDPEQNSKSGPLYCGRMLRSLERLLNTTG